MVEHILESSSEVYWRSGRHEKVGEDGRQLTKEGVVLLKQEKNEMRVSTRTEDRKTAACSL